MKSHGLNESSGIDLEVHDIDYYCSKRIRIRMVFGIDNFLLPKTNWMDFINWKTNVRNSYERLQEWRMQIVNTKL